MFSPWRLLSAYYMSEGNQTTKAISSGFYIQELTVSSGLLEKIIYFRCGSLSRQESDILIRMPLSPFTQKMCISRDHNISQPGCSEGGP